jgi:REP element-mobilizing transposase RayT
LIHLIFSTKHRQPWITPQVETELYAYMAAIFKECSSSALRINGTADHIHALFVLARTQRVCDVVEEVKKRSSKWIKTKGGPLAQFQWQTGYAAFSIGESNKPALLKYIDDQKVHHSTQSFQDEYRAFFRKYKVQFDEEHGRD